MQTVPRAAALAATLTTVGGCQDIAGALIGGYVEQRLEQQLEPEPEPDVEQELEPGHPTIDFPELPGGRTREEGLDFGVEVSAATIELDQPFRVQYTASSDATHLLWLDYELGFVNGRVLGDDSNDHEWWRLEGPFGVEGGPQWTLRHTGERSPVVEHRFSVVYGSQRNSVDGKGIASATEFLAVLPAAPAGTKVVITGAWRAQEGTTPRRLRLVVTD